MVNIQSNLNDMKSMMTQVDYQRKEDQKDVKRLTEEMKRVVEGHEKLETYVKDLDNGCKINSERQEANISSISKLFNKHMNDTEL